jgi:hypothetical protein
MKSLSLVITLFMAGSYLTSRAQNSYEPQILILSPGNFTFDPSLKKEVDLKNEDLKKVSSQQTIFGQQDMKNNLAPNLKMMQQNDIDFLHHIDFSKQISFYAQQYLVYLFFEKFPNCLILLKDQKSTGSLDDLQKLAADQHIPYIINFSKLSLFKKNGETYCKLQMQLYEQRTNKLLIDKEYSGDWNNPGFEFTCEQGSIGCTISNALSLSMPEVISQIASNNPTLKKEKELSARRLAFISDSIYPKKYDDVLIKKIIPLSNITIELNDLYHCFYNADNSKFVAFFIKTIDAKDAKSLLNEKKDENVKIITSKDIHDPGYLDQSPRTYAFIVQGVKYQDKWYCSKSEVTYFDAANLKEGKIEYLNNLQKWDFFADNTAETATGFWDGKLFEKIKDKRKDPNWEKYKKMWEMDERDDRDYIGLYTIVADELKKTKELENDAFRKELITNYMIPFYNKQAKLRVNHIIKASNPEEFNLIYPKDRHVVLNPIKITDEKGVTSIRYFVFLLSTHEVFEWNFVPRHVMHQGEFANESILKGIGTLTKWDYSFKTLDDDIFWNEKVFAKEGSNYKYLKKIE